MKVLLFMLALLLLSSVAVAQSIEVAPTPKPIQAMPQVVQALPPTALFSIEFDDGFQSAYTQALPMLDANHVKATWFIISGHIGDPSYITKDEVIYLMKDGQEIGDHTVTHPNLADLTASQQKAQIQKSTNYLQALLSAPLKAFAYPYGARNGDTSFLLSTAGYVSARTTDWGINVKDMTDPMQLKAYCFDSSINVSAIQGIIDNAGPNTWTILVFHRVGELGNIISVNPEIVKATIDYLIQKHATIITQSDGAAQFFRGISQ